MFTKILIANRGEIACRVIKTAKKMGIKTVAVYSEADRHALFVEQADEAYFLGGSEPSESYLKIERILEIAALSNVEAIHPGYGFLSENPTLPELCDKHDIAFIGPPAAAIRAMGSKSEAKNIMLNANVPLVPGYHGEEQDIDTLTAKALDVGFPQLIKASAGGGGKGMRIVRKADDIQQAISAAKREAKSAFGDEKLLIERYIEQPRHIEVQIFCDQHGNGVYLYDRDCSVQRRHQKIIEEAPAPGLSADTRKKMGEAALNCAQAINYVGAGTVEFLLDKNHDFYFMEMNTRLQVEHPVTEMITQQDLVEWQLKVANGEPLPFGQADIPCVGHAFESRIYAENPDNNFLPATGKLDFLHQPEESTQVRVDSGVRQGDEISVFYDPMIAKLIVWGENRRSAAQKMYQALNKLHIAGVDTNCDFLRKIILHPSFLKEEITTEFIDTHSVALFGKSELDITVLLITAALYVDNIVTPKTPINSSTVNPHSPWNATDFWQLNGSPVTRFTLTLDTTDYTFEATTGREGTLSIRYNDRVYPILYSIKDNAISTLINGSKQTSNFFINNNIITLFKEHSTLKFSLPNTLFHGEEDHPESSLLAPLHGKIVSLEIEPGKRVTKGDALVIIEAMKMEHTIVAPASGTIKAYYCTVNDIVDAEQQLIEFEPEQIIKQD